MISSICQTGGSVTYTIVGSVASGATGILENTATVTPPLGLLDPTPNNASATDTDTIEVHADLGMFKTDGVTSVTAGHQVTYTIIAYNAGPSDISDALVSDMLPATLESASWTCVGAGGGDCDSMADGDILELVDLPAGGSVTFTLTATVSAQASGTLVNTAEVSPPLGVTDANPDDNDASDSDTIVPAAPSCSLTCPSDVVVSNDQSQWGAVVNYPAPTPDGDCGAVTASPPSGSFFLVGTTSITATDQQSGASCGFDVTVTDGESPQISCPADVFVTSYDSCSAAGSV